MSEFAGRVEELAGLMTEFGLEEAKLSGKDWSVELAVNPKNGAVVAATAVASNANAESPPRPRPKSKSKAAEVPTGIPVSSPMSGIYYAASSPGSPPFAQEGDLVQAGQVVALIEAMKVFSEIHAPVSGRVIKVVADNGKLVQPGDPLLYIG